MELILSANSQANLNILRQQISLIKASLSSLDAIDRNDSIVENVELEKQNEHEYLARKQGILLMLSKSLLLIGSNYGYNANSLTELDNLLGQHQKGRVSNNTFKALYDLPNSWIHKIISLEKSIAYQLRDWESSSVKMEQGFSASNLIATSKENNKPHWVNIPSLDLHTLINQLENLTDNYVANETEY